MKKKIFASLLISASIIGGLSLTTTVKADDVINNTKGVVTTLKMARLYDENGKVITNRALANNTPWVTDEEVEFDQLGKLYRVATNEFVKAGDVQLQHGQDESGVINVGTHQAAVYSYQDGNYKSSGNALASYSKWRYNRVDNFNGKTWYQVSNDSWINSDDASTAVTIGNTGIAEISYASSQGTDVYQGYGSNKVATGQKLTNGTQWKFSQKVIDTNGDSWYMIGNNQWISSGFTKITNESFDQNAAENWDPNYAVVKVNKDSGVYKDSSFSAGKTKDVGAGALLEVDSTVQDGNTIWYEVSNGGWVPSTNVSALTLNRDPISLNGKSKSQAIEEVISAAKQQLGKPYVWNGKGPDNFDCSGLMQYVFRQVTGQNIGAWTVPQETAGTRVSMNDIQRGDLIFWGTPGASYHVALYLGNNQYLNALRPGTNVKIDSILSSFRPSFGVRIF